MGLTAKKTIMFSYTLSLRRSSDLDKQLRYINRLTVFVRKLLKLVPQEKREELENEFDSILLEVTDSNERNDWVIVM